MWPTLTQFLAKPTWLTQLDWIGLGPHGKQVSWIGLIDLNTGPNLDSTPKFT